MSNDPLLQPYQLKHLTLRNRIMSTAHEPAYCEEGLPKDRYRLYHVEKARGGIALTMTAGSTVVSPDSPEAFGSLHAYRAEIVPCPWRWAAPSRSASSQRIRSRPSPACGGCPPSATSSARQGASSSPICDGEPARAKATGCASWRPPAAGRTLTSSFRLKPTSGTSS